MDEHEREFDSFFEKIYFHELDSREKVTQRLQMPLVAFLALTGFIGTMLQNVQRNLGICEVWYFWLPMLLSVTCLSGAFFYFVRSVMGKKYAYHALPEDWQNFHNDCKNQFAGFDHYNLLITASIKHRVRESYARSASKNGEVNASKFALLFNLFRWLLAAVLFTILTFFAFYFGRLDKGSFPSGVGLFEVSSRKKGKDVSQKPPPPPPAPPMREIREDRPKPAPVPPAPAPDPR